MAAEGGHEVSDNDIDHKSSVLKDLGTHLPQIIVQQISGKIQQTQQEKHCQLKCNNIHDGSSTLNTCNFVLREQYLPFVMKKMPIGQLPAPPSCLTSNMSFLSN